LRKVVRSIKKS